MWSAEDFRDEALGALRDEEYPNGRLVNGRMVAVLRSPLVGNARDVALGFSTIPPGLSTEAHHHVAEEIAYIVTGTGYVEMDGERFELGPGSVIFTPSNSVHRTTATGTTPLVSAWVYAPSGSELRWLSEEAVPDEAAPVAEGAVDASDRP